jgi:hypothetical protein
VSDDDVTAGSEDGWVTAEEGEEGECSQEEAGDDDGDDDDDDGDDDGDDDDDDDDDDDGGDIGLHHNLADSSSHASDAEDDNPVYNDENDAFRDLMQIQAELSGLAAGGNAGGIGIRLLNQHPQARRLLAYLGEALPIPSPSPPF